MEKKAFSPEEEKALKLIENDKRLKKVYDSWAGRADSKGMDMQKKYLAAVMEYGEDVGGYDKENETFRKAKWEMKK